MKLMKIVVVALLSIVLIFTVACESQTSKTYTLYTSTNGQGSITPNGGTFSDGDEVTLVAVPVSGWEFSHWEGDCTGSQNPTTIRIDRSKTVVAFFRQTGTPGATPTPTFNPTQTPYPTPTPMVNPTTTPQPTQTTTSSGGPKPHPGDAGGKERDITGYTPNTVTAGIDITNSGGPGNVFVNVTDSVGGSYTSLYASKVFYMDGGERVIVMANFSSSDCRGGGGCLQPPIVFTYTTRAALPGDTSQGNITVERNVGLYN